MKTEKVRREYCETPCYCGWAYKGKKCRELRKKHPELGEGF